MSSGLYPAPADKMTGLVTVCAEIQLLSSPPVRGGHNQAASAQVPSHCKEELQLKVQTLTSLLARSVGGCGDKRSRVIQNSEM